MVSQITEDGMFGMNGVVRGLIAVAVVALSACASQVTRTEPANAPRAPVRALSSFEVKMSPNSSAQLADNLKFDLDTLRATIKRTLESKNLIAADGDFELVVVVDDIRVRGTFSAIMFGFMAGDDHLNGTATLLGRDGKPLGSFGVKTSWAFGGLAGGQDSSRMSWLYEEFSKKLADELVERRDAKR
jgi:hypothetical protein